MVINTLEGACTLSHLNGPSWAATRSDFFRGLFIGHDTLIHSLTADKYGDLINSWAQMFGPVFKIRYILGKSLVYLVSPEAAEHVFVKNSVNYVKPTIMRMSVMNVLGGQGLFLSEGRTHRRLRKIVAPAFHHQSLLNLSEILFDEARRMVNTLDQQLDQSETSSRTAAKDVEIFADNSIDVDDMTGVQALRVIVRSAFATELDAESELYKMLRAHFVEAPPLWRLILGALLPSSRFDKYMAWGYSHLSVLRGALLKIVRKRQKVFVDRQNPSLNESTDLLSLLVDAKERQNTLTDTEIVDQMMTFLVAGTVTTSMTMSWCIHNLAKHRDWQDRLYREVADLVYKGTLHQDFGRQPEAEGATSSEKRHAEEDLLCIDSLKELDAFVRETLRLRTPVTNLVRTTLADDEILGQHIPKGTQVRIPITALHRSEHFGSSPKAFDPSRWLSKNPSLESLTRKSFIPFIWGNHACIGRKLSLYEIKVHLAILLLRFEVHPAVNGDPAEPVGFLYKFKGGRVQLRQRPR